MGRRMTTEVIEQDGHGEQQGGCTETAPVDPGSSA